MSDAHSQGAQLLMRSYPATFCLIADSAYATEQDVRACLGDRHAWVEERFLHRLTSKVPPATVVRVRDSFACDTGDRAPL